VALTLIWRLEDRVVDRRGLLKRLDKAWSEFQEARAGLSEAQLMIRGVTGKWSVRDILAHVTTWEEEALKHLPLVLKGGKPPRYSLTYGGIDAFNALKTEQKENLALAQILEEMHDVHRRLIAYIESVPLGQFQEETRFRHRLRLDTYSHYPIHAKAIWKWREKEGFVVTKLS
jgi:DinB superfamily